VGHKRGFSRKKVRWWKQKLGVFPDQKNLGVVATIKEKGTGAKEKLIKKKKSRGFGRKKLGGGEVHLSRPTAGD